MTPILVEHRRTLISDRSDVREFAPGVTIADIVAQLPVVAEFATHGAVYLKANREDPGHVVPRENWRLVRPKPGTALFVSVVPRGGGDAGKNIFATIAAIALIALTSFVGAGGLGTTFLSGAFAPGSIGAAVGAAALGVEGAVEIGFAGGTS